MPVSALEEYQQILIEIDDIRTRMEGMRTNNQLTDKDIETVYESLFLRAVVGFEQFCESQFFDILKGDVRYALADVERHVKQCEYSALHAIVMQDDDYLDWLPFPRSESRSKLFFRNGHPFTNLDDGERSKIKMCLLIRHAISHASDHARGEFERVVIGNQPLLPAERTPAGYLRSQVRGQARFETHTAQLSAIAAKIYGKPHWRRQTRSR